MPNWAGEWKMFPGGAVLEQPEHKARSGDRDSELCQKLRAATDDHRVLWKPVVGSAYLLYSPERLSGQIKLAFQRSGTIADGPVALYYMADGNKEAMLSPDYPDLCGLLASVHRQVGRAEQAIAEVIEYLDKL